MRRCSHNVLYDPIFVFTDEEYCLYPGCRDEKEYYGAQFCSEDHLDQANDEGKLDMPLHSLLRLLLVKEGNPTCIYMYPKNSQHARG